MARRSYRYPGAPGQEPISIGRGHYGFAKSGQFPKDVIMPFPTLKFGFVCICLLLSPCFLVPLMAQSDLETEDISGEKQKVNRGPASTDATSAKIISLHLARNGGVENIKSIKTLKKTGSSKEGKELLQITEYYKAPNKYRLEKRYRLGGRKYLSVLATDGQTVWSREVTPEKKPPVVIKGAAAKKILADADIYGELVDWKAKGHRFSYQGKSSVNGRPAFLLKAYLNNGEVKWYYFDSKTFLVTRLGFTEIFAGTKVDADIFPVKIKPLNGTYQNETIEFTASNQVYRTIAYDEIIANTDISDDLFTLPKVKQFTLRQKSR